MKAKNFNRLRRKKLINISARMPENRWFYLLTGKTTNFPPQAGLGFITFFWKVMKNKNNPE